MGAALGNDRLTSGLIVDLHHNTALQAASRIPAAAVGRDDLGTIEVGKRADLVGSTTTWPSGGRGSTVRWDGRGLAVA